jgi:transposase
MGERRGQYPAELRARAVRLVGESKSEYDSEWAAITSIAAKLGIGTAENVPNVVGHGVRGVRDRLPLPADPRLASR